jgi:site-specific DNA-methyltransferase (adenine-specific)
MTSKQVMVTGDAIVAMSSMADNSVEVVVTSPPYNIGVLYEASSDNRSDYDAWTLRWLSEATRVSRRGVMLNIDTKPSEQSRLYRLLGQIAERFTIQTSLVWVKSVHVNGTTVGHVKPINSRRYANAAHELILHIVDGDPVDVDRLAVGVPYADKSNLARFGAAGRADIRCAGSVWFEPYETKNARGAHPAAYPVRLARRMIDYAGGTGAVLDPFAGSGTTLVAAKALGRDAIGVDASEHYGEIAKARLANSPTFKEDSDAVS